MNPALETIRPDPASQAAYEKFYPICEAAYQALVPVYDMLAEVS
jgi:sugar (pentulose or hexulose) kinase